jgi:hypothetical protein
VLSWLHRRRVESEPGGIGFTLTQSSLTTEAGRCAVALEENSFRRCRRFGNLTTLLWVALIENFGYRQLSTRWRLRGLASAIRGDQNCGAMERQGLDSLLATPPERRMAIRFMREYLNRR